MKRKKTPSEMADFCITRSVRSYKNTKVSTWWLTQAGKWNAIAAYLFKKLGIYA